MKLADFYQEIGPYLLGQRKYADTVQSLYGKDPPAEAERLRIYGRFCRRHRQEALESVFAYCRDAILATAGGQSGEEYWDDLVERYFVAHPMHHFEINQNGVYFPSFLKELVDSEELPPFLGELADFEWWEWVTDTLPEDPADAALDAGPLRLHSLVELRPYHYDFINWLNDDRQEPTPAEQDCVVLFFRNRNLQGRRDLATPLEMMVLKAVLESVPIDGDFAARIGVHREVLEATVADLRAAGILLGSP